MRKFALDYMEYIVMKSKRTVAFEFLKFLLCYYLNYKLYNIFCHCIMTMCCSEHPGLKCGNVLKSQNNNQAKICCLVLGPVPRHCV